LKFKNAGVIVPIMEPEKKKDNTKIIAIILGIILIGVIGAFLFKKFGSNSSSTVSASTAIAGTLNINGVVPSGSVLVLSQMESGSGAAPTEFSTVNNPTDQASWTFSGAQSGKTYIIQGMLKSSNGVELSKSNTITVTAPATNQVITINLIGKDLTGVAEISGTVKVNGFIPSGSSVSLLAKTPNTQYQAVREGMPARESTSVSTDKAVAGQEYTIIGYLYNSNGAKIGESDPLDIVAPARNEVLTINSNAAAPTPTNAPTNAPAPKSKISGTIRLNGVAPSNSRIVILQAPMNSSDFTVAIDNVPAKDGQAWVWPGAVSGTWYNMQAVLKQRQSNGTDIDVAVSGQQTVAAPAINVLFTINSGIAPSITPTPTPNQ